MADDQGGNAEQYRDDFQHGSHDSVVHSGLRRDWTPTRRPYNKYTVTKIGHVALGRLFRNYR